MSSKFIKRKSRLLGKPTFMQLSGIKKAFPDAKVLSKTWNSFEVTINIQPTSLSETYTIKICYMKAVMVRVYVIDKKLKIAPNRKKLPHVYNSEKQQLCLYSPSKKEWKSTLNIVDTIIPWASEWLYYYELWLPEGKWYGGGHNEYPNEIEVNIINEE